nr:LysM peptidoglycan-binding domain-containing protein [Solimonas marina]
MLLAAGLVPTTYAQANASAPPSGGSSDAESPLPVVDNRFPRYQALTPSVKFWTKIFAQYSEKQSIVHSSVYPNKIFKVLDFRSYSQPDSDYAFNKLRRKHEQDAEDEVDQLLKRLDAKQDAPDQMTADERRLYDLFADVPGRSKFKDAIGTFRVQHGLRERTEHALEVSDRYLPSMEQTFAGYSLPKLLTRLPLVESSFNLDAYSRAGAAGIWQFIPSSARAYMRLNDIVDDRRDPWTSTDAAARHLRDDHDKLGDWPLAITAYNYGRNGIARALDSVHGKTLMDLIDHYDSRRFGFASKNYYAEFLAAIDVEHAYRTRTAVADRAKPLEFEVVETKNYVPYDTLRRLCGASDDVFRRLNPAYRPEVIEGKLYVPPNHLIRVPYGSARAFEVGYAKLGAHERFDQQRVYFQLYRVRRGDNLSTIASHHDVSMHEIMRASGLRSASMLRIGQILKIPPKTEARPGPITVAVGESKPTQTLEQRLDAARETQRENDAARQQGAAQQYLVHEVRRGQTLTGIAQQYNVSLSDLRDANSIRGSVLHIGQKLRIPARYRLHRVSSGQTLSGIAQRYNTSISALRSANGIKGSVLRVGQTLKVPLDS